MQLVFINIYSRVVEVHLMVSNFLVEMSNANSCFKNSSGSCLKPFVYIHINNRTSS